MTDYRKPEHRREYFDALYRLNLEHRIMPGLVYLYMPELARRHRWDDEQSLWFAFLNGMTQNPITSLRMMEQLPQVPRTPQELDRFTDWFNEQWATLQFDVDRRHQKRDTPAAVRAYAKLVFEHGSQAAMLSGKSYAELWALVRDRYYSFGRLSAFSYLEYVKIMGAGADCDDLLFGDKTGSRSHRNGLLLLLGMDHLVWDKRQPDSHDGRYENFDRMCGWLAAQAEAYLRHFNTRCPHALGVGRFTLESNLCTFKNHFYGRRYPGVYADMAWERILKAEAVGLSSVTQVFRQIREDHLPDWLRIETYDEALTPAQRGALFPETGVPYRAEEFL